VRKKRRLAKPPLIIRQSFPNLVARRYKAFLLRFQAEQHARILAAVEQTAVRLQLMAERDLPRLDTADWEEELQRILAELGLAELAIVALTSRLRQEGEAVFRHVFNQLVTVVENRKVPIVKGAQSIPQNRAIIESWTKENVRLVTKMTDDERQRVASIISNNFRAGGNIRDAQKEIREALKVSRKRAELIAQNEIGNLYAQLQQRDNQNLGIRYYEWDTRLDERVRPGHKVMQGKVCRWDDPTVYKDKITDPEWKSRAAIGGVLLHPGYAIRCRCVAGAIIEAGGEFFGSEVTPAR